MLAFGAGLVIYGLYELYISQRLASEGAKTTAQVLGKRVREGAKGRKTYLLEVQYRTAEGRTITQTASVGLQRFDATQRGDTVPVRYLPTAPETFAVGTNVTPNYFPLAAGLSMFVIVGVYQLFRKKPELDQAPVPT
jgi:uncharacterized protein DUF3592